MQTEAMQRGAEMPRVCRISSGFSSSQISCGPAPKQGWCRRRGCGSELPCVQAAPLSERPKMSSLRCRHWSHAVF